MIPNQTQDEEHAYLVRSIVYYVVRVHAKSREEAATKAINLDLSQQELDGMETDSVQDLDSGKTYYY